MITGADRPVRARTTSIVLGLAAIALVDATTLQGQPTDTTRRADSAKKVIDTTKRPANRDVTIPAVNGPVRLAADLSDRVLTVVAGDNVIKTFRIAVGTSSKPTPTGSFKIRKIVWNPAWIPPNQSWAKGKTAKGPGEPGNPMKVAKI